MNGRQYTGHSCRVHVVVASTWRAEDKTRSTERDPQRVRHRLPPQVHHEWPSQAGKRPRTLPGACTDACPQATPPSLQQEQTDALLTLLNLNNPPEPEFNPLTAHSGKTAGAPTGSLKVPAANGPPVWKVLVLDQQTQDVLATVLRVQDLRDVGVTLHVCVARICSSCGR